VIRICKRKKTGFLQQILLQPEEGLLRNDSADATLEGTAPKPKKTIGKIKVQGIVASDSFHGYC